MPSWDFGFGTSAPATVTVQIESEPPGAEARTSVGPTCRTPCSVGVPTTGEFTVSFALAGFQPLTIPVVPVATGDPRESSSVRFDPNPVFAALQPAGPPPKAKKPPAKKRKTAAPKEVVPKQ